MSESPDVCRDCKADLKGRLLCSECKTWQRGRRRWGPFWAELAKGFSDFGIAFTAFMAGWVYITGGHSSTKCKVIGATGQTVLVKVWNAGEKPSVLTEAHLRFDAAPDGELPLQLSTANLPNAIMNGGSTADIALVPTDERLMAHDWKGQQYAPERLIALRGSDPFGPQRMTLCIDVEEDGWWWTGGMHERCDSFPAARVATYLNERVP